MADYAITGKKGTGKTLTSIGIMRDALNEGKRVATNLNLNLDVLMPANSKKSVLRLPDHPDISDLEAIGRGQDGVIEEENGIIVLDEVSHFFNARQYQDKGRSAVLAWLTQSRKRGWDVYYIMQGLPQLDKQVRDTQLEYHITVKRTDKWALPFITTITSILYGEKNAIRFPKGIFAVTKYGIDRDALIIGRKFYRSKNLYAAYETQQLFRESLPAQPNIGDFIRCSDGLHTMLSSWHLKGRYMQSEFTWQQKLELIPQALIYAACKLCGEPVPLKRGMGCNPM